MITLETLEKFVQQALVDSQQYVDEYPVNDIAAILSFRTVGLNLPRKSGKTRTLKEYYAQNSALYFDGVTGNFIDPNTRSTISDRQFIGSRFYGMKYNCFVLDELRSNHFDQRVIPMLQLLIQRNLITRDFHIVSLNTLC